MPVVLKAWLRSKLRPDLTICIMRCPPQRPSTYRAVTPTISEIKVASRKHKGTTTRFALRLPVGATHDLPQPDVLRLVRQVRPAAEEGRQALLGVLQSNDAWALGTDQD